MADLCENPITVKKQSVVSVSLVSAEDEAAVLQHPLLTPAPDLESAASQLAPRPPYSPAAMMDQHSDGQCSQNQNTSCCKADCLCNLIPLTSNQQDDALDVDEIYQVLGRDILKSSLLEDIDLYLECDDDSVYVMPPIPNQCIDFPPGSKLCIRISLPPPTHKDIRRHSCSKCQYSCTRESLLNDHRAKAHHEKNLFPCPACDYIGQRNIHLQKHFHRKHPHLKKGPLGPFQERINATSNRPTDVATSNRPTDVSSAVTLMKASKEILDVVKSPTYSCISDDCSDSSASRVYLNMSESNCLMTSFPISCSKSTNLWDNVEVVNDSTSSRSTTPNIASLVKNSGSNQNVSGVPSLLLAGNHDLSVTNLPRRFKVPGTNCNIIACIRDTEAPYTRRWGSIQESGHLLTANSTSTIEMLQQVNQNANELYSDMPCLIPGESEKKVEGSTSDKCLYQCSNCTFSCRSQKLLKAHSDRTHNPARPVHCCDKCGRIFKQKRSLKAHLKVHAGKLDFQCQFCHKCFASQNYLRLHVLTHSIARHYICEVESCRKLFRAQGHLKQHVRTVHGTPTFTCPHPGCGKMFTIERAMRMHYNVHTATYVCLNTKCGKTFRDKFNLTTHQKTHMK